MVRGIPDVYTPDKRFFFDEKKAKDLERRQKARNKRLGSLTPQKQFAPPKPPKFTGQVTTVDPDKSTPSVSIGAMLRMFGKTIAPFATAVLSPKEAADATYDTGPFYWQKTNFDRTPEMQDLAIGYVEPILPTVRPKVKWETRPPDFNAPLGPELPEVSPQFFREIDTPAYTRSPKKGTITINVPDYVVQRPLTLDPMPELFPDTDIRVEPFPDIWPEVQDMVPELAKAPPRTGRIRDLSEETVSLEIGVSPKTETKQETVTLRIRRTRVRASRKRRKETKAHSRWIKAAYKFISYTYGTYTEMKDLMECIAWNAYITRRKKDGTLVRVPALALEEGSLLGVMKGIGEGKYDLDIGKVIIDFTIMQATDAVIGKMNKKIVQDWIDTGSWQSMSGPSSFTNKMTKDFGNVSSLFTPN